jgi:hypothetical protein
MLRKDLLLTLLRGQDIGTELLANPGFWPLVMLS